jgi:cyanate lyase
VPPPATELDHFVTQRLRDLDLSIRDFAARVGVSHVFVFKVINGQSPLPSEQFDSWCKGLNLSNEQEMEFLRKTLIAQSPIQIKQLIHRLEGRISVLESQIKITNQS